MCFIVVHQYLYSVIMLIYNVMGLKYPQSIGISLSLWKINCHIIIQQNHLAIALNSYVARLTFSDDNNKIWSLFVDNIFAKN